MSNIFSRRSFLKASAAAVLAVSFSGALAGCSDDGSGNQVASATISLGEFDVTVTADIGITGSETVGKDGVSYLYAPKVKIKYNGNSKLDVKNFRDVFSAKIGDTETKLKNPTSTVNSTDFPLGSTATYQPTFAVPEKDNTAFRQGTAFKLSVTLQSKTAVFTMTSDGKVTVAPEEKA